MYPMLVLVLDDAIVSITTYRKSGVDDCTLASLTVARVATTGVFRGLLLPNVASCSELG